MGFVNVVTTTTTIREHPQAFGSNAPNTTGVTAASMATCQQCAAPRTSGAVAWSSTVESAREEAAKRQVPYAIYVCNDAALAVAGEGDAVRTTYKREHSGVSPTLTVFDDTELVAGLNRSGIGVYVKISKTEAQDLDVPVNSLLVRAPNGEKLDSLLGAACNRDSVLALIGGFPEKWKRWQEREKRSGADVKK